MREVIINKKILMAILLAFIMLLVPINSAYSNNGSSVRNNVENKFDNTLLDDKWLIIFDNTALDIGTSVQLTTDGGYIVTGIAEPLSGWIGAFVIKLDRNGNKTWGKVMGGLDEDRAGYSVIQANDGSFIITGSYWYEAYVWLAKISNNGKVIWEKSYLILDIHDMAWGYEVIQTFDGGYCIVGRTGDYKSYDIFIIKTDSNGNKIFEKTYDIGAYDYGCSIKQTSDEGFIIVGFSLQELTNDRMCLLKTDKNGILQWNKIFKLRGRYCQGYSLQITDDNGYIITGCAKPNRKADYNIWLLKTDENGTVLWENTFGGEYKGEGRSVQISDDGGYIITGCCNYKAVLIITDSKGEIEWSKTYGGQYFDCAYSVQQTNDGGYILTGCHQVSHHGYTDLFVLKTDSEGNAPPFGNSRHNVNMFRYRTTINSYLLRLFDMFPILQKTLNYIL